MRSLSVTHRRAALACVVWCGLSVRCGTLRQEELECEEAVARLYECCPSAPLSEVNCTYEEGGCEGEPRVPDIPVRQSRCVRTLSCLELTTQGVCDHAAPMSLVNALVRSCK